jgi:hypothetical protein
VSQLGMLPSSQKLSIAANPAPDQGGTGGAVAPVWNGILHEFRNHLTVLLAATTELRAEMPASMALQVAEAVTETERNVQSLGSLITFMDASVTEAEPLICDLDGTIERALRLARPSVGHRVSVTASRGRKAGVRNIGSALESLLASLIVDLARAGEGKASDLSRCHSIVVRTEQGPRSMAIEIESTGVRPAAGSWRHLLASDLAVKLGAVIVPHPESPGYVVQFR